jgi:monofunctional biosynthetic peptidoglycan transglycosylase
MAKASKSSKGRSSKPAAKPAPKPARAPREPRGPFRPVRRLVFFCVRLGIYAVLVLSLLLGVLSVINPPTTHTMWSEKRRLGDIDHEWVPLEEIAPVVARSVVAAEDAQFCQHWGFDLDAIRAAIEAGGRRGGSSITQQVAKNVFLWQDRSWTRKALETAITPMIELFWSKRRILEVYLNIAEMDEGVFGVEAAAHRYFGVGPDELSPRQAALIATVLPAPKLRSAARPTDRQSRKARQIASGAATIRADGRSACFED